MIFDILKIVFELAFWLLVLFMSYVTVMVLRDLRQAGLLTFMDKVFGYPILYLIGLPLDAFFNLFFSVWMWSFGGLLKGELLITAHSKRLAKLPASSKGYDKYRRERSRALLIWLSKYDKSGGHDAPKEGA